MSENNGTPSTDTTSSFPNGQTDGIDDGRILQLSEIIVTEMRASGAPRRPPPQIYRVDETLLVADKGAYHPRFLSLGPYHRGGSDSATEEMRRSDERKPKNLVYAIEGGGGPSVVEYMTAIASVEGEARSCYDRDVTMGWDAFCRMLLLDAFQLISLLEFLGYEPPPPVDHDSSHGGGGQEGCNPKTDVLGKIGHDLMMLENQVPFFVVKKMYGLRHGEGGSEAIAELAWGFIRNIMSGVPIPTACSRPPVEFQHLVHLCHVYLKPSNLAAEPLDRAGREFGRFRRATEYLVQMCHVYLRPRNLAEPLGSSTCGRDYGRFRRATEYYEAGVRFRPLHNEQEDPLLDVSFSNGVLKMVRHKIDEKTNYILRNVLVYEQRYLSTATGRDTGYVTVYVVFMSQLLGSPEDVALLSRCGVLEHHLANDDEVCALFRGLVQGLVFEPSSDHYLNAVGMKLRAYYGSRLNRWGSWIIRHRLSNPWLTAAWVFGAAAILGTIIQTVICLLQYLNQAQH